MTVLLRPRADLKAAIRTMTTEAVDVPDPLHPTVM